MSLKNKEMSICWKSPEHGVDVWRFTKLSSILIREDVEGPEIPLDLFMRSILDRLIKVEKFLKEIKEIE
jgi:hypothetical protein